MSLARPEALWLLIPVALLVAARLFWQGRERRVVTTLMIWKKLAAMPAARGAARRRPPLEFVLEGVVSTLLVLWLAGPQASPSYDGARLVVLRDSGFAMRAPARAAQADAAIAGWRRDFPGGVRVVDEPPQASEASAFATWGFDWAASAARHAAPDETVAIVSDRVARPADLPGGTGIALADAPVRNAGITAAGVSAAGDRLYIGVTVSESQGAGPVGVLLREGGRERRLDVEAVPGRQTGIEVELSPSGAGDAMAREPVVVALESRDELSFDDRVVLVPALPAARIVVEPGLEAFEDAAAAAGFEPLRGGSDLAAERDLVRIGRRLVARAGASIIVPPAGGLEWSLGPAVSVRGIPLRAGPALADVPLGSLSLKEIRPVPRQGGVEPLLAAGADVAIGGSRERGLVVFGFDPVAEGLHDSAVFPLMVRALLAWLGAVPGPAAPAPWIVHRIGWPIELAAASGAGMLETPSGRLEPWTADAAGRVRIILAEAGEHTLHDGGRRLRLSAAPLDVEESAALTGGSARPPVPARATPRPRSLGSEVAGAALACFAGLIAVRRRDQRRPRAV